MAKAVSLKDKFNDLAMLHGVYNVWGAAAKPSLPTEAEEALMAAVMANDGEKFIYNLPVHQDYMKIQEIGAEAFGLKKACEVEMKFLRQADFNMSVILPFMQAAEAKSCMPPVEQPESLKKLCQKYKLSALQSLLPA